MEAITNFKDLVNFTLNVLIGVAVQLLPIATIILVVILIIFWVKKNEAKTQFKAKIIKYLKFYGAFWALGLASLAIKLVLSSIEFFK